MEMVGWPVGRIESSNKVNVPKLIQFVASSELTTISPVLFYLGKTFKRILVITSFFTEQQQHPSSIKLRGSWYRCLTGCLLKLPRKALPVGRKEMLQVKSKKVADRTVANDLIKVHNFSYEKKTNIYRYKDTAVNEINRIQKVCEMKLTHEM
ncbi:hypothetical protein FF38_10968 [Lucilia cuprina]|uniref:Uncharacterized protein n=1 Tax=Lucilia cuprina TaxID=7375 RepID=A0A0L0CRI1_LUCCU|nr:hypothetical protein FF38_10968 [Lucilia cuprina]